MSLLAVRYFTAPLGPTFVGQGFRAPGHLVRVSPLRSGRRSSDKVWLIVAYNESVPGTCSLSVMRS
ncbi:MAG: hypothetical protein KC481_07640, partial [Acidimicrobiaceae bacterium]|nr:hypothetical protein [Acidimicrobiaceae bacterium]